MMKITIDTQTDTHEDIKKVLHILTNILEKKDTIEQTDSTPMMGMFDNGSSQDSQSSPQVSSELPQTSGFPQSSEPIHASEFSQAPELRQISDPLPIEPQTAEEEPEPADTPPDFNALLDLTRKKEEKKDPKIEFF